MAFEEVSLKALREFSKLLKSEIVLSLIAAGALADFINWVIENEGCFSVIAGATTMVDPLVGMLKRSLRRAATWSDSTKFEVVATAA